jgi:hypothetical protein
VIRHFQYKHHLASLLFPPSQKVLDHLAHESIFIKTFQDLSATYI